MSWILERNLNAIRAETDADKRLPIHRLSGAASDLQMSIFSTLRVFLIFVAINVFASSYAVAQSDAQPIQEFIKLKSKWADLEGSAFRLEGQYRSISKNLLRFKNCDLSFWGKSDFPSISRSSKTVEVVGRIGRRNNKLAFIVDRLTELPSDLQTFLAMQSKLDSKSFEDWYKLGNWSQNRGNFYEDEKLLKRSRFAYNKGVTLEYDTFKAEKPENYFQLAKKIESFELPDERAAELVHEGFWVAYRKVVITDEKQVAALLARIKTDLTGSIIPIAPPKPLLRETYKKSPIQTYAKADKLQRRTLHRMLYSELLLAPIISKAEKDGSNGFEIAEKIEKDIPELAALAENYRLQELEYKLANVAKYPRQAMQELSKQFHDRNDPKKARQVIATWIEARAKSILDGNDDDDRLELANDYLNLLGDQEKCVEILKKAHAKNPKNSDIVSRLQDLGYVLVGERWYTKAEADKMPQATTKKKTGVVSIGDSPEDVRRLLGVPTSVSKIASRRFILKVWIYREESIPKIAIHFKSRSRTADLEVFNVSPIRD